MTLADLAKLERSLLGELPQGGFLDERLPVIQRLGLFERWNQVFLEYVRLLEDPDLGQEALKRALFLTWYPWVEPPALTGISDLDAPSQRRVLEEVDRILRDGKADAELRYMLRAYGQLQLPFDLHQDLRALCAVAFAPGELPAPCPLGPMKGRGAMGDYWTSRNGLSR